MPLIRKAFKRLHYPVDIIAQCVRWYLAYSFSLRNLEEMMAERGIIVDHFTLPAGLSALSRHWIRRFADVNAPWVGGGEWTKPTPKLKGNGNICTGQSIQQARPSTFCSHLSGMPRRLCVSFAKPFCHHDEPEVVTIDKSGANTVALTTLNAGKPDEETMTIRHIYIPEQPRGTGPSKYQFGELGLCLGSNHDGAHKR